MEVIMSSDHENQSPKANDPELDTAPDRTRDPGEADMPEPSTQIDTITASIARFYGILPIGEEEGTIVVASAKSDHYDIATELRALLGHPVRVVSATPEEIKAGLRERYGLGSGLVEGLEETDGRGPSIFSPQVQDLNNSTKTASVVSWANEVLLQASKERATDVHLVSYEDAFRVRDLEKTQFPRHNLQISPAIFCRVSQAVTTCSRCVALCPTANRIVNTSSSLVWVR
jgi:type II secretory ATPase GspE/PulE/Tfp pilus assembly ATPase PilB-like protein